MWDQWNSPWNGSYKDTAPASSNELICQSNWENVSMCLTENISEEKPVISWSETYSALFVCSVHVVPDYWPNIPLVYRGRPCCIHQSKYRISDEKEKWQQTFLCSFTMVRTTKMRKVSRSDTSGPLGTYRFVTLPVNQEAMIIIFVLGIVRNVCYLTIQETQSN